MHGDWWVAAVSFLSQNAPRSSQKICKQRLAILHKHDIHNSQRSITIAAHLLGNTTRVTLLFGGIQNTSRSTFTELDEVVSFTSRCCSHHPVQRRFGCPFNCTTGWLTVLFRQSSHGPPPSLAQVMSTATRDLLWNYSRWGHKVSESLPLELSFRKRRVVVVCLLKRIELTYDEVVLSRAVRQRSSNCRIEPVPIIIV